MGESLTEEEAMERIRKDEEERKRKEEEKAQKAEARKRKREERERKKKEKEKRKEERAKKKNKGKTSQRSEGESDEWFCPQCLLPYQDNDVWVECDGCQLWFHADCCGYSGWTVEELATETFVCMICEVEKVSYM